MDNSNHIKTQPFQQPAPTRDQAIAELTKGRISERIWIYVTAAIVAASIGVTTYRSIPADIAMMIAWNIGLAIFLGSAAWQENRLLQSQMKAVIACLTADQTPGQPASENKPVSEGKEQGAPTK